MKDLFQFLKEVPVFKGLSDEEIRVVEKTCHPAEYNPNDVIIEEGTKGNRFYIITEGHVEVWKDYRDAERSLLAVNGPGHFVGEMALIEDMPRSATVIARQPVKLFYIPREDFNRIIQENGRIALSIMKTVSSIVRDSTNSFVDSLRRRNRELEEINRELRDTQEELLRNERLSALGKFSSLVIHDIRNPLSVIRTLAEMIQLNSADPEKLERNTKRIVHEVDQLSRMAGELLDFARGEVRLNMSIVDLRPFFGRFLEEISERYRNRNIQMETELEFQGTVILDEPRMMRVMQNLADNAYKAMPDGGIFRIHVDRTDTSLRIEVSDNGVGMSAEVQKKIFEPFFSRSREGGTGLGMSIVQSIVLAHKGTLSVKSQRNSGTTFLISLPLFS